MALTLDLDFLQQSLLTCFRSHSNLNPERCRTDLGLFMRGLLPFSEAICPNDEIQGGIAFRASPTGLFLHPYLYRQITGSGAILGQSSDSLRLHDLEFESEDSIHFRLKEAVERCCSREVFQSSIDNLKILQHDPVSLTVSLLPFMQNLPSNLRTHALVNVFQELKSPRNQTRFALMSAVTGVARKLSNPEHRWQLEELGGAIGAALLPPSRPNLVRTGIENPTLVAPGEHDVPTSHHVSY